MRTYESVEVPGQVFTHLIGGIVRDTAHDVLRSWEPGHVPHLGDPFGKVLAWLWKANPDHAVSVFADVMLQLRHWDERATKQITLDEVLLCLPMALQGLTQHEEDELIHRLRAEVPRRFSVDPNHVE